MAKNMKLVGEIIKYLESQYEKYGSYKTHSGELIQHFNKRSKGDVASTISYMKKDGTITSLEEKVPAHLQRGAVYFALTSILEKVTNPEKEEVSKVMDIPGQVKPTLPVANPFDSVNQKLATIMSQLEDYAVGLTQLQGSVKRTAAVPEGFDTLIAKAVSDRTIIDYGTILNKLDDIPQNLDTVVAEQVAGLLSDQYKHVKSLLMELTETKHGDLMMAFSKVHGRFDKLGDFTSTDVNSSEDYKRGIRDGIRMAIEMGLMLSPNGE